MNKQFRKIMFFIIFAQLMLILAANLLYLHARRESADRMYRAEAKRVAAQLREKSIAQIDLSRYKTIVGVREFRAGEIGKYDYVVEEAGGVLYRIEYVHSATNRGLIWMNVALAVMFAASTGVLFYVRAKIVKPFGRMNDYAQQLAKGNLSAPLKEEKGKFFGRFLWGIDMLRETLEERKRREMDLQKEKKTLVLSLSHDIKTPLSAIELYTKALRENLYESEEKRTQALLGIAKNAGQIRDYIGQITDASREDFLHLEVRRSEFYLADVMQEISAYYRDKLSVIHTEFEMQETANCLLKGDRDRMVEVLQNLMENAVKYGDGKCIRIFFGEEEDCRLITVSNTGCSVKDDELPHLFDSFYRGSNVGNAPGSGIGLYIAKELMKKMDGDLYAEIAGDDFNVTVVARKA